MYRLFRKFEGSRQVGNGELHVCYTLVSCILNIYTRISLVQYLLDNSLLFDFRCNNVLYVRGVDEEEEDGEMRE